MSVLPNSAKLISVCSFALLSRPLMSLHHVPSTSIYLTRSTARVLTQCSSRQLRISHLGMQTVAQCQQAPVTFARAGSTEHAE